MFCSRNREAEQHNNIFLLHVLPVFKKAGDQAEPKNLERESSDEKPPQENQPGKYYDAIYSVVAMLHNYSHGVIYFLIIGKVSPNTANTVLTTSTPDMVQPGLHLATAGHPVTGLPLSVETEKIPTEIESDMKESCEKCESDKKDEEPNMEHFAKAAENLVMSLDDEVQ